MPKRTVDEIITNLNRVNLDTKPFDEIYADIKLLMRGVVIASHAAPVGRFLYRAVRAVPKPTHAARLSYPPVDAVIGHERCNRLGKPMFYASASPHAIFLELGAKVGEIFYLSTWEIEKTFSWYPIGSLVFREPNANTAVIQHYFDTKFTQPVHKVFSSQYKITAAIAQMLSTAPMGDGVLYTSVAHYARAPNVAVRPDVVDKCLRLRDVMEVRILENPETQANLKFRELDFSDEFAKDGAIAWLGKSSSDGQGKLNLQIDDDFRWVTKDADGKFIGMF